MLRSKGHVALKERQHDYLYDPVYTLASSRDHERMMQKSMNHIGRLERIFSFNNLFSEIPVYMPFQWRFKGKDPVPPCVPRNFRPADICGELLRIQLKAAGGFDMEEDVVGRHRAKYFAHHTINPQTYPAGNAINVDRAIEALAMNRGLLGDNTDQRITMYASKKVQTDYRDSEAQTDPYSPPYVVNVGETPEVLTLATLGMGKGLPAGLHDVEMIERARERRQIEANLEPFSEIANDPKKVAKRRKILQHLELREWHYREREVEALQEVRMKVLVQLLRKREEHQQEIAAKRLDRIWEERCNEKEARCKAIQQRYITALRKLVCKRLASKESSHKRDMIKEYATPSSQSFAPLTRLGVFPDRGSENYVVKNAYLNTYEGLLELEASLARSALQPKIYIKPIEMYTKDGFLRRAFRHQEELARLQEYLEGAFIVGSEQSRKPRFLEKIEKPPARPATPSIVSPTGDLSLEKDIAAITLQQLVRGRAIQTQMFEGKEKRRELIAELRSTHALLEDDQAEKRRQKLSILSTQEEHAKLIHEDKQVDDILSRFECGSLAEMLDFLSKELDRLIEERRVHALVLLAERNRRMREAEESGTRQREERRRREQDEIFKQIVKVHQESVDGYLASVAGLTIDSTASIIAKAEVEEFAQKLDAAARQLEAIRDESRSDLIAADLVHNFLIPEVNKRAYQAELDARQRKFLQAAHREIWIPTHEAAEAEREHVSGQSTPTRRHNSTMTSPMDEHPTVQDGSSCGE